MNITEFRPGGQYHGSGARPPRRGSAATMAPRAQYFSHPDRNATVHSGTPVIGAVLLSSAKQEASRMESPEPAERAQSIEDWSALCAQAEKSGNYLGACDAALLGLEQHPKARELQYRAILNLSRAGANKRAQQLWSRYGLQANFDTATADRTLEENIAAVGARLDREEAFAAPPAQRPAKLKKAAEHYDSIYRRVETTFLGINAAVLHELSGASVRAKEIAARIVADCAKAKPQSQEDAYQLAADRAAASLVLDDLVDARRAIEHAAALATNAASIASTRKQLIQICGHKHIGPEIVEPLRNRTVVHYTGHMIAPDGAPGRFPAYAEAEVAKKIKVELDNHNVGYGFGSLACGADTLIVEALLDRDGEVNVVLPFETDSFVKESVAGGGANWLNRFDRCRQRVQRLVQATDGDYTGDAEVFAYASRLAMGLAMLRAQQLSSRLIQLAVWDGRETDQKAGTFADIRTWQGHRLETVKIDSAGNLATNGTRSGPEQPPGHALPPRKVRAIMFGDFHGFSRLTDRQMLIYYDHVLLRVATVLDKHGAAIATRNTWGDGLFVVFSDLGEAARCALEIQSSLAELDWLSLGLPGTLGLRLGLDAGAVFEVRDPVLKSLSFTGSHISRTARLEPSTPPGEVYVTEGFAALFTLLEDKELICEYVGKIKAAKDYGYLQTYLLRHRAYSDAGSAQRGA